MSSPFPASQKPPIFVALDVPDEDAALDLSRRLKPHVGGFKIGLELFTSCGPRVVESVGASDVFLDLKFHDIPNTVAGCSHDAESMREIGLNEAPTLGVLRLAELAQKSGLDGVVCSPLEIEAVRKVCGEDFLIVTPGVRPMNAELGDQKRVMTPRDALNAGANWLVVGRPITGASDPVAAARMLFDE